MPEDIEFTSEGTTVRGHLYLPPGDGPFPLHAAPRVMPHPTRTPLRAGVISTSSSA